MMELWTETQDKWAYRFLAVAELVAGWSKDPSTKVGCVIADDGNNIISTGYNGFPPKVADDERLFSRSVKYELTVHAEANALLKAGAKAIGATAYVTQPPCARCTGLLLISGVKAVVCLEPTQDYLHRWSDSVRLSGDMAAEAGVKLYFAPRKR